MIQINDDETAQRYINEFDKSEGDKRIEIGQALGKYSDLIDQRKKEETETHFSKLFTDENYYQAAKEQNYALAEALDPEAAAKRSLINAYLEHRAGREIPSANYEPERDAYAMASFGKKNLDDGQLFDFIRGDYEWQKQRTAAINDLHVQSVGKALADTNLGVDRPFTDGMTGVFNEWSKKYPELVDGKEDAAFLAQSYKLYYDTINDLDSVRPIAGKTLSTLDAFTKGNSTPEDMNALADTLAQATPQEREKVYNYVRLGAEAGQIDRGAMEQFAINFGQSISRGFDFIPQGSLQVQEAGLDDVLQKVKSGQKVWVPADGDVTKATVAEQTPKAQVLAEAPTAGMFATPQDGYREATPQESEQFLTYANNAMQTYQVVRELRNVAKTGVDPIRPVMEKGSFMGAVEGGVYGVGGSIGFLGATAVNPFLGVAAYQSNEYDRIRLENPDMDIKAAQGLALVEGTWQAALDRAQLSTLSGKLPVLGRFLGGIESNGLRRTLKVGASVAEQFGQELAQDTGTILIDNIAAALREDMPDKDFAAEMSKYGEQIPETLAASVLFGLVGGGFATAADLGVTEQQMKFVGINDKKIARIKEATSPEEYNTLIQTALESRTPEDIEAGKTYARQTFNEAQNPPPEAPKITMVADAEGNNEYLVTAPDGTEMLRTKSQQAAIEAVRQDAELQIVNDKSTVRDLVDQWQSEDTGNIVQTTENTTAAEKLAELEAAGNKQQIEVLHRRIAASPFANVPYEEIAILGEATVEDVGDMVFKSVISLANGASPVTAREEIHHVAVRKSLLRGTTNLDQLRGWLDATEKALPDQFPNLYRDTENDIVESLALVQRAYEDGKINADAESKLPPSFIEYIKRMLKVFAEAMKRAVALRGAFKQGILPGDYEAYLAETTGFNQQTLVDTTTDRVSNEVLADTDKVVFQSRAQAQADVPTIRAANASITGPTNYSIGAFHGTPHKVDRFSTDKIGTGEGAQAYGWGLYFAENQKVGEQYRRNLAAGEMTLDGQRFSKTIENYDIFQLVGEFGDDLQKLKKELQKYVSKYDANPYADTKSAEKIIDGIDRSSFDPKGKGNLYSVTLDVEPEDLLDWDKPLSEQSPKVQAALAKLDPDSYSPDGNDYDANEPGQITYNRIPRGVSGSAKVASDTLLAAGIPGIRYLDGNSRDGGSGTSNFVIFDESKIKITGENGQPVAIQDAMSAPADNVSTDTNYSIGTKGIRFDEIAKEDPKHDGSRVGTAWQGKVKPTTQGTNDGIATISDKELEKQMAMLTHFVDGVPLPKYITKFQDAKKRMRAFIDFQKKNLLALYDAFESLSADYVIRSTHWYDGARLLAEGVRDNYRLTIEQSSAIIAVFSPMKDWFQNVAMGQRFADVMANHKNKKITKASMGGAMREMLDAAEDDRKIRKAFKEIEGKSISQLLTDKSKEGRTIAAVAIRLMSTHVHGLSHDVLSPEGESLGTRKNIGGTDKKLVWQSYTFIEKAISIYEDGSAKNISKVLGTEHKIRNFYNNIVAPTSPFGDATVDTHAVNAAVLYPMGNKGYLVGLNFGDAGVAGGGNSGIYWLFHEALREAAKERGVMPRQMQSITWEAIRGLFTDVRKRDKNFVAAITKIWDTSKNADAARTQIIGLGITPPEWARVGGGNSGRKGGERSSTGQVADPAGSVQPGVRQGREGGNRGAGVANYSIGYGGNAITASQEIARDLGASSRAIQEAQPGTSARDAEIQAIRDSESIPWYDIGAFGEPDTVASEHQIWFDEGQVYKATAYGRFGHSIEKGPGNASSLEYLRRIAATNEAFDDSARIFGKFEDKDGNLGLIHVQDFIAENPENPAQPTPKQIIQFLESRGFFRAEGRPTNYEVWINPDIGIEVTDLHPGNLIIDANGKIVPIDVIANKYDSSKGVSYSISSQSEIDRVNRAMSGVTRGPSERLAIYERAKAKFNQVLAQNQKELDDLQKGTLSFRRTQIATSIGMLEAIVDALPPAVRGRVGGYAKLANIVPLDVFKNGEKISEVSTKKGAIISAWMKEGLDIGNAGKKTELPPGYTTKENLATARADRAIATFFKDRIAIVDRELEKALKETYGELFKNYLERTKPKKAAPGEKPKGIGADIQDLFAKVREAVNWSATEVNGHIADIETQIASGELTAEKEAMLSRQADLVSLVGDWKNADSNRRASALAAVKETWQSGMSEFVAKKIREREAREQGRAEAISATGKGGEYTDRRKKTADDNGVRGSASAWFMNLASWDQAVNVLFGHESPIAIRFSDGQRKAENTKVDEIFEKLDAIENLFTELAGGKNIDGQKLRWRMQQTKIPAGGLDLSEFEAIDATMAWAQPDGRRHMEGPLDDKGVPVPGKWRYTQEFIDEIEAALSPEAKAVREFLWKNYAEEYAGINKVYRQLNGINLPNIPKYSPLSVAPVTAPSGMVSDPVTGNAISSSNISPGALRTRGTAVAEPVFKDAIQKYLAHTKQMAHWKAFAPWMSEVNGILRNREVQNAIQEAGGEEAKLVIGKFLDIFAQGGNRDAASQLAINQMFNRAMSRAAQVALVGRVGTLAIQTTQLGAASAELPPGAYIYRLSKLLSGNLGWGEAFKSPYIQRRLREQPLVVQQAMEGLNASSPNALKHSIAKVGGLIGGADALYTAGTYAIVYDYQLEEATKLGFSGEESVAYATNIAERITDRLAQPVRQGSRSIYELLTSTNPFARLGFAFASEARKNIALLAYTKINRPFERFFWATTGFMFLNLAMGALIRNAWKDAKDDDDEEWFDKKNWSWKRLSLAATTEIFQGLPVVGDKFEEGLFALAGEYHHASDLLSLERGARGLKNIPKIMNGERDVEEVLKDIDGIVSMMGLFNQNAASAAALTHMASDFFGVAKNATED